jgi:hypothetical protein
VRPKLLAADSNALIPLYLAVVPLRCLLLQQQDPEKWRTLLTMEAHNAIRRKLPAIWRSNQENVVDRIRKEWGMVQYEEDLIHTICGILEVWFASSLINPLAQLRIYVSSPSVACN